MDHLFDFDFDFEFDGSSFTNPTCSPSPILSVDDIEQLLFKDDDDQVPTGDAEGFLDDILLDSPLKSGETENSDQDPLAKKRKRQLRNRDAAVRSRERKKMHVKDLEMKSRYYEGECRRLGSLLQWYMAENQALRFTLQTTSNASMTKQESAVLLLESLLLGSLLWLMVVLPSLLVLLLLTPLLQSQMESVLLVLEKHLPSLAPRKGASETTRLVGKRFKASRARMRQLVRGRFFDLFSFSYLDLVINMRIGSVF